VSGYAVSPQPARPSIWLCGEISTFIHKVVSPGIWFSVMAYAGYAVVTGKVSQSLGTNLMFGIPILGTAIYIGWVTAHLQRVGHRGRMLLVANYWRRTEIPFEQIKSIRTGIFTSTRMVRIGFNQPTPFGSFVYYMPKWRLIQAIDGSVDQRDLQKLVDHELRRPS
jgi:hypothetical protein